ncbi:MAG: Na/Pi symporter, partial [Eubacterium sp.]|nr:Na/Pi symporter [Eubacterium sp.]
SNPILGILAGALLTAVIQSSSASVGILQALAVTGSITVSSAFPIILGQNIGTCITALISSVGTSKNGKRTAVIHLIFNTLGVAAAMLVFYSVKNILKLPLFEESINAGSIAAIHTIFNVFSTVLLFPFGKWLEKLACIIIPNGKDENSELIDEKFILSNAYAIDKAKEQCNAMAETALENTILSLNILKKYSSSKNNKISENEHRLDKYEDELETYLVKISAGELNLNNSVRLSMLSHAIGNFERIGDYAYNILRVKQQMHRDKIHFSKEANDELEIMSNAVKEITENAISAFINDDLEAANRIEPLEQVIDNLKVQIKAKHSKRMENTQCSIENGILFFDIINSLERIADHCSNLALCIIELSQKSYRIHQYSKGLKSTSSSFIEAFEEYCEKYSLA